MKKFFIFGLLSIQFNVFSQTLNFYRELGYSLSRDNNYGTARFEAMSGAFSALGGDISAFGVNPAGSAIAIKSVASASLSSDNTDYSAQYYGNSDVSRFDNFNFSQAGGILIFDTNSTQWNRFAVTLNYRLKNDFGSFYQVKGNSEFLYNIDHFNDTSNPKNEFDGAIGQEYSVEEIGKSSVFNVGISAVYQDKLFVGSSLNFHNFNLNRIAFLTEENDDISGNILLAENLVDSFVQGNGFSLSLGFIYKFNQNIRIALAYESPTWYNEITEDYLDELSLSDVPNLNIPEGFDAFEEGLLYQFKSHSRLTAGAAYILGKQGLISFDYTYKNYPNIKYTDNSAFFIEDNQNFASQYRAVQLFNIGAEWRFDNLSVRGGYHYEKNPNQLIALGGSTNKDNIRGLSAGLGYNFGNMKVDLSYNKFENQEFESLYNSGDIILNNNTSRVSGTVTFSL
ncbi:MAG: OmpP1/FadL family transporter [Tenacibaculum sp.]